MPFVTIRLENKLMETVTQQAHTLQLSKPVYLRKAIEQMARKIAKELRESLIQASFECRAESMRINKTFSPIEGEIRENDSTC